MIASKWIASAVLGVLALPVITLGVQSFNATSSMAYAASPPVVAQTPVATTVRLRSGTPVVIRTVSEIAASKIMSGSSVDFKVIGDVKSEGKVVITDGTLGHATVASVDKNGILGEPASITISDFYINAVDGSRIPLSASLSNEGKSRQVPAVIGMFICLPFLLLKGGDAVIPAGTEKTVYTASEATIELVAK